MLFILCTENKKHNIDLYFNLTGIFMFRLANKNGERMEEDIRIQLYQSIDANDLDGVTECIEAGVNLDTADSNGQTPLIVASEKGRYEIVAELLNRNVDANAKDEDGWTALIASSKEGYVDIVSLLLEHAAKYNIADLSGWTPLVWAAYKGHVEVVRELVRYGANPQARGQHNMTALIWAAGRGHLDVVNELLNNDAKPEIADKYGTSALVWACRKGHCDVSKVLINAGANVNTVGTHGWTSLIMAAKGGYLEVVNVLLEENCNINAVDQDGLSALAWAAKEGHNDILAKLLDRGAFLNMPDRHGDSPLILAAKEGHTNVVRALIGAYADIERPDSEGKTALYHGVEKGHVGVVRELLIVDANIELVNKEGETPLLRGAKMKHTQCVKLLLEKGANVAASDKRGDTPLHVAIRSQFAGLCGVLLDDPKNSKLLHKPNKAGETPYSIDLRNKPSILSRVFTGIQLGQNGLGQLDYCNQKELLLTTVADFLFEPSFRTPLSVGVYSRWGSGKSTQLQRLMELLQEHFHHIPMEPFSVKASAVAGCIFIAVVIAIIVWAASNSYEAGIITAVVISLLLLIFLTFARITLVSTSNSVRHIGVNLTNFIHRFVWFFKLVYCVPPCIQDMRPFLKVHLITVDLTRTVLVTDNPMTSLVNFIRELNDAVEADVGIIIPRLYRIFQTTPYRNRPGENSKLQTRWKKSFCCIPSFLISSIALFCLLLGLVLNGIFNLNGPRAAVAIQIACICVLGGFLLANILRLFVIVYCLILPMKKRVRFVSTQPDVQEETFLSVVRQELELCVDMLECLDGFTHRQTRIVVSIDLLDSLEQQKVLTLINSISMMINEEAYPFVFALSVDPRLLIKAMDQNAGMLQAPYMNSYDYLRKLVDLPFYVIDQTKIPVDNLLPLELRSTLEDQLPISDCEEAELEWDDDADINGDVNGDVNSRIPQNPSSASNGGLMTRTNGELSKQQSARVVKFPSDGNDKDTADDKTEDKNIMEDISNLIRTNMNGNLNDIRRIMNIVSLKGRILRNADINFHFTRLALWVNVCDIWPHRASWIVLLCADGRLALPGKMSIRRLYNTLGYGMPMVGDVDENTGDANNYFDTFLASYKPKLSVNDVRIFTPYLFYLDPTIRSLMVDYMIAIKSGSLSKNPSIQNQYSSRSNFPSSPSDSSKFIWRGGETAVDELYLSKMTAEDVVSHLAEIDGMDTSLLPAYRKNLIEHNVNGRVLVTCELNELREAMEMKFGDWQLFKAWINSSRYKEGSLRSEKLSLYRPISRGNSYADGSQSESIHESPKHSSISSAVQRGGNRLPALEETTDGMTKVPYARHSPRTTPTSSRSSNKQRKLVTTNPTPQDSENTGPSLKGGHSPNPGWHRSADSGFASTDVDPNKPQAIQQQTSFSDNDRLIPSATAAERPSQSYTPEHINDNSLELRIVNADNSENYESKLRRTGALMDDTWNKKEEVEIGFNHIYKTSDPLSSGSSQEFLPQIGSNNVSGKKSWKFAKLSDDSISERGVVINKNIVSTETSFITDINANLSDHQSLQRIRRNDTRSPSFSDVPLPPQSMLNETGGEELRAIDDVRVEIAEIPLPPSSSDRKTAFQKASRTRGKSF